MTEVEYMALTQVKITEFEEIYSLDRERAYEFATNLDPQMVYQGNAIERS